MLDAALFPTFIKGLVVSGGLIIAIGAQNAFVLKQGLLKNHIFWVALTCFLCDFVLMSFWRAWLWIIDQPKPDRDDCACGGWRAVFGGIWISRHALGDQRR